MELLATTKDKLDNTVSVYFVQHKNMPGQVTSFLLRGWAELIDNGHCTPNYVPVITDNRLIYCMINDIVVGLLMWEWSNNTAFINFTLVHPDYRNNGIYNILHTYYDGRVVAAGAKDSKSQLHINNVAVIHAAMKQGYEIEYYRMIKRY